MSIADQIRRIKNAKAAIKQSIENKGVTVGDDVKLDKYAEYIDNIEVGSGSEYTWPDFWELRTKNKYGYQYLFSYITIRESDARYKELIENLDVSRFISYSDMFYKFNEGNDSNKIKELDLTKWKNMGQTLYYSIAGMFEDCTLDYLNVSGLDFSNIASGTYFNIFYYTKVKEINMTNCNVSGIKNYYRFAYGATELVTINMTGCDTSAMTSASGMFNNCTKLTTIIGELDASNLTSGFYPGSSTNPFYNCTSLETLYLKNIYKDITVTDASKFSIDLGVTKVKDECLVYIIDQLPNLADKGVTNNTAIKLTLPTVNTLTDEQKQVALDKGWIVVN